MQRGLAHCTRGVCASPNSSHHGSCPDIRTRMGERASQILLHTVDCETFGSLNLDALDPCPTPWRILSIAWGNSKKTSSGFDPIEGRSRQTTRHGGLFVNDTQFLTFVLLPTVPVAARVSGRQSRMAFMCIPVPTRHSWMDSTSLEHRSGASERDHERGRRSRAVSAEWAPQPGLKLERANPVGFVRRAHPAGSTFDMGRGIVVGLSRRQRGGMPPGPSDGEPHGKANS